VPSFGGGLAAKTSELAVARKVEIEIPEAAGRVRSG
jgi:hypothetical protein